MLKVYHWLSKDLQNSSREADGFIKLLTQDQTEQEKIVWDWMTDKG